MLSNIQKNILIRAVNIRKAQGEDPKKVLENYQSLTKEEKEEILKLM